MSVPWPGEVLVAGRHAYSRVSPGGCAASGMGRQRTRHAVPVDAGFDVDEMASIDDSCAVEGHERTLTANMALLPMVEREVLVLFSLEELSPTNIADAPGAFRSAPSNRGCSARGRFGANKSLWRVVLGKMADALEQLDLTDEEKADPRDQCAQPFGLRLARKPRVRPRISTGHALRLPGLRDWWGIQSA